MRLATLVAVAASLLGHGAIPALAEDAHHPTATPEAGLQPLQPENGKSENGQIDASGTSPGSMGAGAQAGGMAQMNMPQMDMRQMNMMTMMNMMSRPGAAPMMVMMGPDGSMAFGMMGGAPAEGAATMGMSMDAGELIDHVEGRIAFLKAELKIGKTQEQQWEIYTDTLRQTAKSWRETRPQMARTMASPTELPKRLELQDKIFATRLETFRREKSALTSLYGALDAEQKRIADRIFFSPNGMAM